MIETNKIYNMDCIELMKKLPDNYFDLILTDPPYGITKAKWDKVPDKKYFDEMFRVSKNQIIFGYNHFTLPPSRCWICWNKRPFLERVAPCELIWTSFTKYPYVLEYTYAGNYEGYHRDNLRPNYDKKKVFFTSEKPIAIGRHLLKEFANKGDTIFDPFSGSGSFLVASKQLRFDFVGCEINKEHYEHIKKRLSFTTVYDFNPQEEESLISDKRESVDSPNSKPNGFELSRENPKDFPARAFANAKVVYH